MARLSTSFSTCRTGGAVAEVVAVDVVDVVVVVVVDVVDDVLDDEDDVTSNIDESPRASRALASRCHANDAHNKANVLPHPVGAYRTTVRVSRLNVLISKSLCTNLKKAIVATCNAAQCL